LPLVLVLPFDLKGPRRTHFVRHDVGNAVAIDAIVRWRNSSALNDDIDIGGLTTRSLRVKQSFSCKARLLCISRSGLISVGEAAGHSLIKVYGRIHV